MGSGDAHHSCPPAHCRSNFHEFVHGQEHGVRAPAHHDHLGSDHHDAMVEDRRPGIMGECFGAWWHWAWW
ncbi:MAG TPA: hypothetical protein VG034_15115 [Acidimicrobiia bacterium]|nr:hypothetical protein [Acidimicrobiia bacterium]